MTHNSLTSGPIWKPHTTTKPAPASRFQPPKGTTYELWTGRRSATSRQWSGTQVKAVGLPLSTKSWRYAWRITSITSQNGERSIGTVSSGFAQESPTVSTCEVELEPRAPKAMQRPAAQPAPPGAVRNIASAAGQPPHHDSRALQSEPRGNVLDHTQKGEARRRSEVKRKAASWRSALTVRAG